MADAFKGTTDPTVTPEPLNGLVRTTVGTVTLTTAGVEEALKPAESVARAVRLTEPDAAGIQLNEYGAENELPITVDPARKSTFVMVEPPLGDAVAVSGTVEPRPSDEPLAGVSNVTEGPNPFTVTITKGEVAVFKFGVVPVVTTDVSVTDAVRVYVPGEDGNQGIWYEGPKAPPPTVPIDVPLAKNVTEET